MLWEGRKGRLRASALTHDAVEPSFLPEAQPKPRSVWRPWTRNGDDLAFTKADSGRNLTWRPEDESGAGAFRLCFCERGVPLEAGSAEFRGSAHSNRIWKAAEAICWKSSALSQRPAMVLRTNSIRPRAPKSRT